MSLSLVLETLVGVGVKVVQMSLGCPFCLINLWFWLRVSSLPWRSKFNKISRVLAYLVQRSSPSGSGEGSPGSEFKMQSSAPTLDLQPWAGQACRCWGHQVRPSRGITGSGREGEKVCGLWVSGTFSQEADWLNWLPAWTNTKSERSWMSQWVLPLPREREQSGPGGTLPFWLGIFSLQIYGWEVVGETPQRVRRDAWSCLVVLRGRRYMQKQPSTWKLGLK